jgi:hypothetical protein
LPSDPSKQLRFLIQFLPMATRTIQHDGLTIFYLLYWHPSPRGQLKAGARPSQHKYFTSRNSSMP